MGIILTYLTVFYQKVLTFFSALKINYKIEVGLDFCASLEKVEISTFMPRTFRRLNRLLILAIALIKGKI